MSETCPKQCPKCGSDLKAGCEGWWECESLVEMVGDVVIKKGEFLQGRMCEKICKLRASLADSQRLR